MGEELADGETFAPWWTVTCQYKRCSWFADGFVVSELDKAWEAHDEAEHD